jgi:hypothetical protein
VDDDDVALVKQTDAYLEFRIPSIINGSVMNLSTEAYARGKLH